MRALNGLVTWELILLAAVGMIGCVTGDFIGKKVFSHLDGNRLKKVIYVGMILSGILMIL